MLPFYFILFEIQFIYRQENVSVLKIPADFWPRTTPLLAVSKGFPFPLLFKGLELICAVRAPIANAVKAGLCVVLYKEYVRFDKM